MWNPERRAQLRAELDAYYARLYGLDRHELRHVLDPADVKGADYPSETFWVLREREKRGTGRGGWCWRRGIACPDRPGSGYPIANRRTPSC